MFTKSEQLVLRSFFVKLQRQGIGAEDSAYRVIAQSIVREAAARGYGLQELEAACHNYEVAVKIYGDRIEPAEFFTGFEAPALIPYDKVLEENAKRPGAFKRYDSYLHLATWRLYCTPCTVNRWEIPGYVCTWFNGQQTPESIELRKKTFGAMEGGNDGK